MDNKALESRNGIEEEICGQDVEENGNQNHRPFLSRLYSKTTPIGFEYHQVYVPAWTGPSLPLAQRRQQLQKRGILGRLQPIFSAHRVNPDELEEYLAFAQGYFEQKNSDYFTSGTVSRERTRAQAMDFLHKMDYNYIKAKFYILFPYYLTYNAYRCHDPLSISEQDMEKKIRDHLEGLKNTKEKDMQKWVDTLEACLSNRTHFQKFMTLIEQGKQAKYQIPETIKEQIQKSLKVGKQLRKSLQTNKMTIQGLRAKRQLLQQHKLVTPEMISFEDTVTRCQQWTNKQQIFQEKYLEIRDGDFSIKNSTEKIEFKQIMLLVSEYNNLPLQNSQFEHTTRVLYQRTVELLEAMPNINKIVKTRTAKQVSYSKIPYKQMQVYLKKIEEHPIWHQEFINFEINMRESMELIERMNMYLEDPLSEKNSKTLNNYIKLMSDVQIENNVEKRLKTRQECNDIMEKIKKEISNPGRVEYIKEAFTRLREKGIKQVEDLVYQEKILLYLGWHESQEKLKECRGELTNLEIIEKQLYLREKLVDSTDYKSQLESARREWNISEEAISEAYERLQRNQKFIFQMKQLTEEKNPSLDEMISVLKNGISDGLMFPQLWQLHDRIVRHFVTLAKIHSLLSFRAENLEEEVEKKFFFTAAESEHILSISIYPEELKVLKTKEKAEELLQQIRDCYFPKGLEQCRAFEQFMKKGEEWAERVRQLIKNFTEEGDSIDIRELEDSRYFIHSKAIKEQIGKIQSIMRWREKIAKKLEDCRPPLFSQADQEFLAQMQKDLAFFDSQTQNTARAMKQMYLQYTKKYDKKIKHILFLIANESRVQNICKLSEINKFHREIQKQNQRHKIDDKKILELKQKLREQIISADDWKERYLMVKRFEKKKIVKREDSELQNLNQENVMVEESLPKQAKDVLAIQNNDPNQLSPEHIQVPQLNRRKYFVKNGQFTWYFKFLIMVLEFSKGYKLKFCLEELLKLKNTLAQIQKFVTHYDKIFQKNDPADVELLTLDSQASKIQLFIREIWLLKKKMAHVHSWKLIADSILESVPIVNMELKARKPEELLTVLANRKLQTQEANKINNQERNIEPHSMKRQRKPNSYYFSADITFFPDETINSKPKKKKKGSNSNNDSEYRNTAVTSLTKKNNKNQLQQIERTQAIIKANVEAGTLAQDPKEYCICRYGEPNENTTMVQCEGKCQEWFHIECIGIKKHQAKSDLSYICLGCSSLYDMKSTGSFFWDYKSKISEYALEQIVNEGRNLGVFTQQFKRINLVYEKMVNWKKSVQEIIFAILRDDFAGRQISQHKEKLYQLYLLSLWLPTFHYQASTIKRLLLLSRGDNTQTNS